MKSIVPTLGVLSVVVLGLIFVLSNRMPLEEHLSGETDDSKPASTYDQKTNHFDMPRYDPGPVDGHETPYRVNQWSSYEV